MSEQEPDSRSTDARKLGRWEIIERLRLRRQSWRDRKFGDSAELVRRMRDRRVVWGGDGGSPDGGCGGK